jgi:hypothetical protein
MDASGWYWLVWLFVVFLPVELYAAYATPGRKDTFSHFIWWAFAIKPSWAALVPGYRPPRWARGRRLILAGFMGSLSGHFVFGWSSVPLIAFGIGVVFVLAWAVLKERNP